MNVLESVSLQVVIGILPEGVMIPAEGDEHIGVCPGVIDVMAVNWAFVADQTGKTANKFLVGGVVEDGVFWLRHG